MINNALLYSFNKPFLHAPEALEACVADFKLTPCGSQDISKFGFVPPLGKFGDQLTHTVGTTTVFRVAKETKILPAKVINRMLAEKVTLIENDEARKITKKEKDTLKDELTMSLLPRAFVDYVATNFYIIETDHGKMIAYDSGTASKAEEGLALLRKAIGSLPIVPFTVVNPVETILNDHVINETCFNDFEFSGTFKAIDRKDQDCATNLKGYELGEKGSGELLAAIESGKEINLCSLSFGNTVDFKFDTDLKLSGIKFSEEFRALNDDVGTEDLVAKLDADYALHTGELVKLINSLFSQLGPITADL